MLSKVDGILTRLFLMCQVKGAYYLVFMTVKYTLL